MEGEEPVDEFPPEPTGPPSSADVKKDKEPLIAENTRLWRCLQDEDLEAAFLWLSHPQSAQEVNLRDAAFSWSPCHHAAHLGSAPLLKMLVDAKAQVDSPDRENNTPLICACRRNNVEAAEFLLSKRVNINAANTNGWTALIWCAINGCEDTAALLMSAGADLTQTDNEGRTACMWAARHGHLGMVETLLANGLNLSQEDEAGLTAFDHAQEHLEMRSLIAAVQECNNELQAAARQNNLDGAKKAIEDGADVNVRDDDGMTPLMWAAMHQSLDMVQLVVRHGANPNLLDERGEVIETLSPDHLAVGESVLEILGSNERLLAAAKAGRWHEIDEELHIGAWINVRDDNRLTSLMWAARAGASEVVTHLILKNAHLDAIDAGGRMAVHYAAQSRSVETMANLYYLGADFAAKTFEGDSLLHIAVQYNDGAMIQLLLATQADIEDLDFSLRTPLMSAAEGGQTESVQTLLYYSADWKKLQENGTAMTAFLLAVKSQREDTARAMLSDIPLPPKFPSAVKKSERFAAGGEERPVSPPQQPSKPGTPSAKPGTPGTPKGSVGTRKKIVTEEKEKRGENSWALIDVATAKRNQVIKTPFEGITRHLMGQMDANQRTPLILTVLGRSSKIFQMLLDEKADLESVDDEGNSALNFAVATSQREVVASLMELNVRVDRANSAGLKPVDLCTDEVILRMLERRLVGMRVPKTSNTKSQEDQQAAQGSAKKKAPHRIRLEGLPTTWPEQQLVDQIRLFIKKTGAPRPSSVEIPKDPITARPRGFAYADFVDIAATEQVVTGDGKPIEGYPIRVLFEIPYKLDPPPPPPAPAPAGKVK
mmetsp:Transcript_23533/g.42450  ORF Transcript_23533/g.42450 Transcript_23533/m.42450 type:complete len:826 (-) Transcript_23533:143-2620(-)